MRLIRICDLPEARKRWHDGPCPGGTFWALDGAHDLPMGPTTPVAYADPVVLLRHGTLWMANAAHPGSWRVVNDLADLTGFRTTLRDDYTACATYVVVKPFLPEFYYVPRTARGARIIARAMRRAQTRKGI